MRKTEVFSWRVSTRMKTELEEAARRDRESVAKLLEKIVGAWLRSSNGATNDALEQRKLFTAAAKTFGTIRGGDPDRSTSVRAAVRARLRARRAR